MEKPSPVANSNLWILHSKIMKLKVQFNKNKKPDDKWFDTKDEILRKRLKQATPIISKQKSKKLNLNTQLTLKIPKIKIPNSVTLKLPKFSKVKIPKSINKYVSRFKIHLIILLVAVLVLTVVSVLNVQPKTQQNNDQKNEQSIESKPEFNPVISLNKKAAGDLGLRYSPDKKSASFEDEYFSKKIVVSQQQLKKEDASNPVTLERAANSIAQAYSIPITSRKSVSSNNGKMYYYNLPDSEVQRGVMIYKDLLLFFTSEKNLDSDDWQQYLKTLILSE